MSAHAPSVKILTGTLMDAEFALGVINRINCEWMIESVRQSN
jgi:hypothetical protein